MRKKCWPFFHDWEYLERIRAAQLKENVISELDGSNPLRIIREGGDRCYSKKVCLKCGISVDEISPQIKLIKTDYNINKSRELKAKQLMGN